MSNDENKDDRIKELKMKSQRENICGKAVGVINNFKTESFISVEDTAAISKKVYEKNRYITISRRDG